MERLRCLGVLLVLMLAGGLQAGVTISGIDGAVSWVWAEAEDGTIIGPNAEKDNFGVWMVSGYGNSSSPRDGVEAWFDDSDFACTATVPVTMTEAKLYAHCSSYYTVSPRSFSIEKDGVVLGYIWSNQGEDNSVKDPIYWSQSTDSSLTPVGLGTLSQGDVTLRFREGTFNEMRFDGFFLTNGTMDLSNPPITADNGNGCYWMQRPTFTGTLPQLAGPVTPVVANAPAGAKYFINGTECPNGFGTLNTNGTYNLEIRQADNRLLAGASFTLAGQTGVTFSGIDGAACWVWAEAEDGTMTAGEAAKDVFGSWLVSGYGNTSSPRNGVEAWFDDAAFACTVTVPVTITDAKLYAHCSSYYTVSSRPFSVEKDGQILGYIGSNEGADSSLKAPIYWSQSTDASLNPGGLGTLNQGNLALTFREGVYNCMRFDGFFLTNGTMDLANPPITADNSNGCYWMQRPTFAGTLPELQGPVTPVVANAPVDAKYFINDAESLNGFGTLNTNGTYHLEVRRSDNRLLAGASFTVVGAYPPPSFEIPACVTVTVDGNLNEWTNASWTALDKNYDGGGAFDVTEAAYAAKWSIDGDKVYVAVKVRDTAHSFTLDSSAWGSWDGVEIFLHTTGTGTAYYNYQDSAQQYVVGIKQGTTDQVWTSLTDTNTMPESAGFVAAGKVDGEWIYYEVAMTPFEYFGGLSGLPSVASILNANDQIGLDVCVDSSNGTAYTGMKSENGMKNKYLNWEQFRVQTLVSNLIPGDANGDNKVDVSDLGILAANYGTTAGATWDKGDFNHDGKVDVSDLGILAANYGRQTAASSRFASGTGAVLDFNADARALGLITDGGETAKAETPAALGCGSLGLPLVAGMLLLSVLLVKLEE